MPNYQEDTGIYVPEGKAIKHSKNRHEILAVGPLQEMYKPGDVIAIRVPENPNANLGYAVDIEDDDYVQLREHEILGKYAESI